jgi:predicted protein tyrosine phosphatase
MTVFVSSLKTCDRFMKEREFAGLVSIAPHCESRAPKTLLLSFPDTTPHRKPYKGLATGSDVLSVIELARSIEGDLMIHCAKGRSRSTAMALIAMKARGMSGSEACADLFQRYPKSDPNGWVLKLGDIFLGSNLFALCSSHRVKWL